MHRTPAGKSSTLQKHVQERTIWKPSKQSALDQTYPSVSSASPHFGLTSPTTERFFSQRLMVSNSFRAYLELLMDCRVSTWSSKVCFLAFWKITGLEKPPVAADLFRCSWSRSQVASLHLAEEHNLASKSHDDLLRPFLFRVDHKPRKVATLNMAVFVHPTSWVRRLSLVPLLEYAHECDVNQTRRSNHGLLLSEHGKHAKRPANETRSVQSLARLDTQRHVAPSAVDLGQLAFNLQLILRLGKGI